MKRRAELAMVGGANAQPRSAPQWIAFVRRMAEFGYVEGRNRIFDHLQIAGPEGWERGYRAVVAKALDVGFAPEFLIRADEIVE